MLNIQTPKYKISQWSLQIQTMNFISSHEQITPGRQLLHLFMKKNISLFIHKLEQHNIFSIISTMFSFKKQICEKKNKEM